MPLSYFPDTMPQASGDQVMAPTPGRGKPGRVTGGSRPWAPRGLGRGGGAAPTDLVEELGQLHLHLLALEHVVLGLLADGRDQVELPRHGVGLLRGQRGLGGRCPAGRGSGDPPGKQGGDTSASPGEGWPACSPPPRLSWGPGKGYVWVVGPRVTGLAGSTPKSETRVLALSGWEALGKRRDPLCLSFPICCDSQTSRWCSQPPTTAPAGCTVTVCITKVTPGPGARDDRSGRKR